ncbi:unnamed protein product [Pseudo-nitzschia multistriata]|uniref:Uncharacterized protein n=1 Tax=Pseudo-nitzschia multistriata TaxID=183589 RepID=A0A448ZS00_9STRA|nr:unnamed protein product [Pseudo-nitzschia multistriata]
MATSNNCSSSDSPTSTSSRDRASVQTGERNQRNERQQRNQRRLLLRFVLEHRHKFPGRLSRAIERARCTSAGRANGVPPTTPEAPLVPSPGTTSDSDSDFLSRIRRDFEEWLFSEPSKSNYRPPAQRNSSRVGEEQRQASRLELRSNANANADENDSESETATASDIAVSGLDDRVDTQDQVELALRCFPEVLTARRFGLYPIFWLAKSIHSVSFIPLFAKIGNESGLFQDFERGGLVFGGCGKYINVFSQLAAGVADAGHRNNASNNDHDQAYHRLVDEKFLASIKDLRESRLMEKKDIANHDLLGALHRQSIFPEQRFRYLVDWDPRNTLLKKKAYGTTLSWDLVSRYIINNIGENHLVTGHSHHTVHNQSNHNRNSKNSHNHNKSNHNGPQQCATAGVEMLFELALKYFPIETGFLFHKCDVRRRKRHTRGVTDYYFLYCDDATLKRRCCRKHTLGSSRRSLSPSSSSPQPGVARENHEHGFFEQRSASSSLPTTNTATTKGTTKTRATVTKTMTPYRIACEIYGIECANKILETALAGVIDGTSNVASSSTANSSSNDDDVMAMALINAASDPNVDLDCVYILLQRDPGLCKPNGKRN